MMQALPHTCCIAPPQPHLRPQQQRSQGHCAQAVGRTGVAVHAQLVCVAKRLTRPATPTSCAGIATPLGPTACAHSLRLTRKSARACAHRALPAAGSLSQPLSPPAHPRLHEHRRSCSPGAARRAGSACAACWPACRPSRPSTRSARSRQRGRRVLLCAGGRATAPVQAPQPAATPGARGLTARFAPLKHALPRTHICSRTRARTRTRTRTCR